MIRERERHTASGLLMLTVFVVIVAVAVVGLVRAARADDVLVAVVCVLAIVASILGLAGLFTVAPNEGQVLQLFGAYRGTAKDEGLRWANPFYTKKRTSLRVRNFESAHLKVNDTDGNPIEIAAIVVWRVVDTAEAVFEVDDYGNYVRVQTESAVRNLATHYPYDAHVEGHLSLRGSTDEVAKGLKKEIQEIDMPGDALVISLIRQDHGLIPSADTRFEIGDSVIALVHADKEHELRNIFAEPAG